MLRNFTSHETLDLSTKDDTLMYGKKADPCSSHLCMSFGLTASGVCTHRRRSQVSREHEIVPKQRSIAVGGIVVRAFPIATRITVYVTHLMISLLRTTSFIPCDLCC